ncbi:hypothetical protein N7539_004237 [Penicillium diatomitis]|uniref:Uncharacterized protein n=1 Tax=Penicillium diatomitis TaxID=2819901 RepID=A0A9W9XDL8_9EURO|nr:uncharacterized protein N7539_004237 [Penicillium diatomitis]KAJ5489347.1 hypothetical protein N7539_004237 [Penicillium diatomitis]
MDLVDNPDHSVLAMLALCLPLIYAANEKFSRSLRYNIEQPFDSTDDQDNHFAALAKIISPG